MLPVIRISISLKQIPDKHIFIHTAGAGPA